jgi:hypothetical protein
LLASSGSSDLLHAVFSIGLFFDPVVGGDIFLQNIACISSDYMPLYPRTLHHNGSEKLKSGSFAFCSRKASFDRISESLTVQITPQQMFLHFMLMETKLVEKNPSYFFTEYGSSLTCCQLSAIEQCSKLFDSNPHKSIPI